MITYLTATIITGIIFILYVKPENVLFELGKINWASLGLGIAIIGLEAGYILAYRSGWHVNTAPLIANTCLAIALIGIGALLYKESITFKQLAGIIICLLGIVMINF
jgi:drug/metabolite transporter (DMT)-like permease